jgi:hypothetical protein
MHPEGAGLDHSDPCGIPKVKELHLLRQNTPQSIDQGSSGGSAVVGIQGSQTNLDEANLDMHKSNECVCAVITT